MGRLVGDARSSWLQNKPLRDQEEAQQLADLASKYCSGINGVKPVVVFTGMTTKLTNGTADSKTGVIRIHRLGETWGTLTHELAHLHGERRGPSHGWGFYLAHLELLEFMEGLAS